MGSKSPYQAGDIICYVSSLSGAALLQMPGHWLGSFYLLACSRISFNIGDTKKGSTQGNKK